MKWQCREHVFLFQLTFITIYITPINITLCILEKNKIKSALRPEGHAEVDPNF